MSLASTNPNVKYLILNFFLYNMFQTYKTFWCNSKRTISPRVILFEMRLLVEREYIK